METALDIASFADSAYTFKKEPNLENFGYLALDTVSVAVPGVGGTWVLKALKAPSLKEVKAAGKLAKKTSWTAKRTLDGKRLTNVKVAKKTAKKVASTIENANYAQRTYSNTFSKEGRKIYSKMAGRTINTVDDLVDAIKKGDIDYRKITVDYIVKDGNALILNTRTSQALTLANVPRKKWNAINKTGVKSYEERLREQLKRNGLTSKGIKSVKRK